MASGAVSTRSQGTLSSAAGRYENIATATQSFSGPVVFFWNGSGIEDQMRVPTGQTTIAWFEGAGRQWIAFEKATGLVRGELVPVFKDKNSQPQRSVVNTRASEASERNNKAAEPPSTRKGVPANVRVMRKPFGFGANQNQSKFGCQPKPAASSEPETVERRVLNVVEQQQKDSGKPKSLSQGPQVPDLPTPYQVPNPITPSTFITYDPNEPPFEFFTQTGNRPLDEDEDLVWVYGNGRYCASRFSTLQHDPSAKPRLMTQRISFWVIPNAKRRLRQLKRRITGDPRTQWDSEVPVFEGDWKTMQDDGLEQEPEPAASSGSLEQRNPVSNLAHRMSAETPAKATGISALSTLAPGTPIEGYRNRRREALAASQPQIASPAIAVPDVESGLDNDGSPVPSRKRKAVQGQGIQRSLSQMQRIDARSSARAAQAPSNIVAPFTQQVSTVSNPTSRPSMQRQQDTERQAPTAYQTQHASTATSDSEAEVELDDDGYPVSPSKRKPDPNDEFTNLASPKRQKTVTVAGSPFVQLVHIAAPLELDEAGYPISPSTHGQETEKRNRRETQEVVSGSVPHDTSHRSPNEAVDDTATWTRRPELDPPSQLETIANAYGDPLSPERTIPEISAWEQQFDDILTSWYDETGLPH
ncbi:MAG: hypothetical protein LQ338_005074 [Usnochroma carphineum]|nr:MAG: hypothetical protein LQ338_005074 [Usnochroma carphineum]